MNSESIETTDQPNPTAQTDAVTTDGSIAEDLELKIYAKLYGEPVLELPRDLFIPPDAMEVFLEAFEGPLDLLLYMIRKQNFDILDIPVSEVTS